MACSPRSAPRFLTRQTSPSCRARWPGRSPAGGRGSGVLWAWPGPACCRAVRAWTNGCFPERTAGCPFAPPPRSSRASLAARGPASGPAGGAAAPRCGVGVTPAPPPPGPSSARPAALGVLTVGACLSFWPQPRERGTSLRFAGTEKRRVERRVPPPTGEPVLERGRRGPRASRSGPCRPGRTARQSVRWGSGRVARTGGRGRVPVAARRHALPAYAQR